jgi:hypothetical protein
MFWFKTKVPNGILSSLARVSVQSISLGWLYIANTANRINVTIIPM